MSQNQHEYQNRGIANNEPGMLKISQLFDRENNAVVIAITTKDKVITNFWMESESGNKLDLIALLPSRERIQAKLSDKCKFSAALHDHQPAILEWKEQIDGYTTEDILAFLHELGHAMDGVQISYETFLLRVRSHRPNTPLELHVFLQDEGKAQENAKRILRVLIRKKILKDSESLQTLIDNWDADYKKRIIQKYPVDT